MREKDKSSHLQVAGGFDGLLQGHDDLLALSQIRHGLQVLRNGFAGDRQAAAVYQAVLQQQLHHCRRASNLLQRAVSVRSQIILSMLCLLEYVNALPFASPYYQNLTRVRL